MTMIKILLPTDFSENAQKSIDYALGLFKNETCTFYLLHGYHDAPSSGRSKMTVQKDLNRLISELESRNSGKHLFKGILETDSVLNLTNRTQVNEGADYVFVGTKGSSMLREILVGSNTLDLIRYLNNCPVVVVPTAYESEGLREIVFATDFKRDFIVRELKPLLQMASLWDATLHIAHVGTGEPLTLSQKNNRENLRNVLKGKKHYFFEVKPQVSVANTLYKIEMENQNIDMMAILRTKQGFFHKFIKEDIVKNIAFKTEIPLLVVPQIG